MSLLAPITISEEAALIYARLDTWGANKGVEVKIMAHMGHLWEEVLNPKAATIEKLRLLICYDGETARGGFANQDHLHRVDRKWIVVVMRAHGWEAHLTAQGAEAGVVVESFYDQVETIRELLRTMTNISEEFPINYTGIRTMQNLGQTPVANVFLDGFRIEFTTANEIPTVTLDNPNLSEPPH